MNDIARQKLKELISRFGTSLATDRMRCLGMMRDMCREQKKEISGIMTALEEGIPTAIMKPDFSIEITRKLLILKLENDRGLAKEVAEWSVDTWAIALGVLTESQLPPDTTAPQPQQISAPTPSPQPQVQTPRHQPSAPVPSPQRPSVVHNSAPSRSSAKVNLNQPRPTPSPNNSGVPSSSSQNQLTSRRRLFFALISIIAMAIMLVLTMKFFTQKPQSPTLSNNNQNPSSLPTVTLDAEAYYNRGLDKYLLRDNQGAIEEYNQAIQINPRYAEAYINRGNAKSALGDPSAAADLQKAAELGF